MADEDNRSLNPLSSETDDEDVDPPLFSPLRWNRHDKELPLVNPLGLNQKKAANSNENPPTSVADEEFQQKVNLAYQTLPPTIRELADFPPIEILEEPLYPKPGRETLGRFFGIPRSKKSNWINPVTPTVIHVYRGPVLRYAGNQVDSVLKTVVWHEVAHWLGFQTEREVAELGLQLGPSPNATGP
jgi:predicted Zn-dependent protease with MMP-like domain